MDLESNPFRFCGEYWDSDTETLYLRNRHYDPTIGRFTSEDPINDGINWYTYCGNNPVMHVDPSGLSLMSLISAALTVAAKAASTSVNSTSSSSSTSSKSNSSSSSSSSKSTSSSSSGSSSTSTGKSTASSSTSAKPNLGNDSYAAVAAAPLVPVILGGLKDLAIIVGSAILGGSLVKDATESKEKAKGKIPEAPSKQGSSEDNAQTSDANRKHKSPTSGSGKEKATDVPSWAKGNAPYVGENGKDFAERLMDEQYGKGNWGGKHDRMREYGQIKKWGDRGFK